LGSFKIDVPFAIKEAFSLVLNNAESFGGDLLQRF
jgi:hypothetical protein